ncbi:MAG: hypothetical protein J3Q66DRAFT_397071 [Benniella sp.]|nr:MAG: hypothetical protein J3Q66DRAFT_408100 [Benniella sp.]KAK3822592.1 MAG: hypothetical protein J3Q66DRAFT_397071 [Benniella sp.]
MQSLEASAVHGLWQLPKTKAILAGSSISTLLLLLTANHPRLLEITLMKLVFALRICLEPSGGGRGRLIPDQTEPLTLKVEPQIPSSKMILQSQDIDHIAYQPNQDMKV